ncbi:MAG: hypothetical protein WBC97_12015 [Gemmatimonadales bacterium]
MSADFTRNPLFRHTLSAAALMAGYRPHFEHPNKQTIYDIAVPVGATHTGAIECTRWPELPLPQHVDLSAVDQLCEAQPNPYAYQAALPGAVEWHVNFADPELFGHFEGPLFAQDEIQVAEHPGLGAVRDELRRRGEWTLTMDEGRPTPILVSGVERRCSVSTRPNARVGWPQGLYGNNLAKAPSESIPSAVTLVEPPTITNLIAMVAPLPRYGVYDRDTIEFVLGTVYTAFAAARGESARIGGAEAPVVVHTGFWGCGAFGGNRQLMTALQLIGARMAGIDRVVFHAMDQAGVAQVAAVVASVPELSTGVAPVGTILDQVEARGYRWGSGDGT